MIKKIYNTLPVRLQQISNLYRFINKPVWKQKEFIQEYNFLNKSEYWKKQELRNYQIKKLGQLLVYSYRHIPYYRKVMKKAKFDPEKFNSLEDIKKLPILDKETFRKNFNNKQIISNRFKKNNKKLVTTSGTTGKPLHFFQSRESILKEWAFIFHQWKRVGYYPGQKRIELRGKVNKKNMAHYDYRTNTLRLSPLICSYSQLVAYVNLINSFKAKYLHGYPGAIAEFAQMLYNHNIQNSIEVRAVLLASENVYPWQRRIIKEAFDCKIYSHYGCSEQIILGGECEKSTYYHCIPQYSYVEINKKSGEIIGTSLLNHVNPFIRYKITDIATQTSRVCKHCHREYYPLIRQVEGRLEDFITSSHGSNISPAIITHPFKKLTTIKNTSIIQKNKRLLLVLFEVFKNSNKIVQKKEMTQISLDLKKITGLCVEYKIVSSIKKNENGKFKWIRNKYVQKK